MRRAHDADPERIGRHGIGAEQIGARDLGHAVDPRQARTDRSAGGRSGGGGAAHVHHRIDDLAVAGAAAEHAAQRILDLGAARRVTVGQHVLRRHQHAGRADAALRRAMIEKRLLQRRERAVGVGQALDRLDRPAVHLAHRHQAGADLPAVEQHGAGAAVAGIAADLGAGEAEVVAQRGGQARDRRAAPVGGAGRSG